MSNTKKNRKQKISENKTIIRVICQNCNHKQRTKKNVQDTICSVCLKQQMRIE